MKLSNIPKSERAVVKAIAKFLSGEPMLTHTTQEGIAIQLDKENAFVLDFNLHTVKSKIKQDPTKCIAMTVIDAVFIRHLTYLRQEMLDRMGLISLPWTLLPSYYIELQNGKKFSLPSLLTKYTSAARRDSITLSAGLWKFLWYFKISYNLPEGQLSIINDGTFRSMIDSKFSYNGKIYSKGDTIEVGNVHTSRVR